MQPLLASALFALGCSFALAALHGGESALAAVTLMAACVFVHLCRFLGR